MTAPNAGQVPAPGSDAARVKYHWEDCSMGFECPYCGADLLVDSQNEPILCQCGAIYYLSAVLKITPPPATLRPRPDAETGDAE